MTVRPIRARSTDAVAESGDRRIDDQRQRRAGMRGDTGGVVVSLSSSSNATVATPTVSERRDSRRRDDGFVQQRPHDAAVGQHQPVDPRNGLRGEGRARR